MKTRLYLSVFVFFVIAVACSKSTNKPEPAVENPGTEQPKELHNVRFNFADFVVNIQDGRKGATREMSAKDYLTWLYYNVYDSSGRFIKQITQNKWNNSTDFGSISDSLTPGKYNIVFIGSANDSVSFFNNSQLATVQIKQFFAENWLHADVFCKRFQLNMSNKDTSISNLKLNRVTGALEVKLTDSLIPSDVSYVAVMTKNAPFRFNVMEENAVGSDSANVGIYEPRYNPYPSIVSSHFGSENKLQIVIRAFDNNRNIIAQKIVDNVYVYSNKRTVLSGSLFSTTSSSSTGMSVIIDPDFAETINQTF